ncbi:MAG: glycosyltransferase family A protein [Actinomycetota bacterium]|nr:glycosyltransferase family A protein [Actinomycetota bacterium]
MRPPGEYRLPALHHTPHSRPRVTVAIPFFNEERFLAAAVHTVRAQTETSWELLLIDDGSSDGSPALADELARALPERISVLRHPGGGNRGLPASRNLAISAARGTHLCFLDADDLWSEHKLARQLEMFREHPEVVMVCGPSRHQPLGDEEPGPIVPVCVDAPRVLGRGQFARMRMRGHLTTPGSDDVMYRLATLRRVGGVPDGPAMLEDQRTFVAVSLAGPVYVDDRPLTTYTVRNDSLSGSTRDDDLATVRHHREFERWVVSSCRRQGPMGWWVVACLLERRLRRGVGRRLRMLAR